MGWEILDRMEQAVAKVRERLLRATGVLNRARIPYAVVGGHAVASWVATVDEGAVRNTRDVDLLIRREDLPAVTLFMEAFNRPQTGGGHAVAGAVLIGSAMIALAIATHRGSDYR
jgi:hypothetical protein